MVVEKPSVVTYMKLERMKRARVTLIFGIVGGRASCL